MRRVKEVEDDEVDGCECCMQWGLLLTNLPIMLIGISMVILGVWFLNENTYTDVLQSSNGALLDAIVVMVIVIGGLIMVLSIFGCFSAFLESKPMLLIYYGLTLLLFLAVLACTACTYAYKSNVSSSLRQELADTVSAYDPGRSNAPVTAAWDRMQRELQCCGVAKPGTTGPASRQPWRVWRDNLRLNSGKADARVPKSCCLAVSADKQVTADCTSSNQVDTDRIYTEDCFDNALDFLQGHMVTLAVVCIVFGLALVLAAVLAVCLYFLVD